MTDLLAARATLTTRLAAQWNDALKSLPAAAVVDGLALHRRWTTSQQRQAPQTPWDDHRAVRQRDLGISTTSPDFTALVDVLKALDDLVDSVGRQRRSRECLPARSRQSAPLRCHVGCHRRG